MRQTDKYVFFYRSKLGQWSICPMVINDITYNCCEQYMMYQKALLFNDLETADKILKEKDPKTQKNLGRQVKNFDLSIWEENAKRIVFDGNFAKFSQNKEYRDIIMSFRDKIFVEASPTDLVWGVGYREDDPMIDDEKNWRGKNWLGEVLTNVRNTMGILKM